MFLRGNESGSRSRQIELLCPEVGKQVQLVAFEEQKLDLGSIGRTFGLDPATVKLNGYFISRGLDLISSSVTWKSLLSFFASRGLSTGSNHLDALTIHGKRENNPSGSVDGCCESTKCNNQGIKRKPELENSNVLKKRRLHTSNTGRELKASDSSSSVQLNLKRLRGDETLIPTSCKKIR